MKLFFPQMLFFIKIHLEKQTGPELEKGLYINLV